MGVSLRREHGVMYGSMSLYSTCVSVRVTTLPYGLVYVYCVYCAFMVTRGHCVYIGYMDHE